MNATAEQQEPDLIDRIANALPPEVRTDYYREMRHCRSLPENDEMLRILRAMQFSVLLIHQAPERMATQTEKLREIFSEVLEALRQIWQSSQAHQAQLDRRLAQLPPAIAEGIRPETIAAAINESLRQQFVQSTIPETAHALTVAGTQIRQSTAEFAQSARALSTAYNGAVEEARKAIAKLESTSSQAIADVAYRAAHAHHIFERGNRWSLYVLLALALVTGIGFEMAYQHFLNSPGPQIQCAPVVQSAPPIKSRPKR
jgi:hypothetical protein